MHGQIEWLGTGSGLNPSLGNTSFAYRGNEGRTLLIDCGATVPLKLIERQRIGEITDIIITHTHADHIGGLETLGFMNYFALKKRGRDRPKLYLGSPEFAAALWQHSLRGGMEKIYDDQGLPFDANLNTYFQVEMGRNVSIHGLPTATLFPTPHVRGMENYGVRFDNGVFYSGDTLAMPDTNARIIFQDCQFFQGVADVHISYQRLKKELSEKDRAKIHLVHLGAGYKDIDAKKDGFAGFVMPEDRFDL